MTVTAAGVTIAAHSQLALSPGKGHLMIQQLYGPLKPGQTVNLQLDFSHNGTILVTAPVIAIGAPAPTAGAR
jgi:copper(I)-binding protein